MLTDFSCIDDGMWPKKERQEDLDHLRTNQSLCKRELRLKGWWLREF